MRPKELTVRGLILGALITTIFTAANVYLGLKVGLTFASSIPAAVISMAILSAVKDSSILENNIVQTVASAAGTLSATGGKSKAAVWVDIRLLFPSCGEAQECARSDRTQLSAPDTLWHNGHCTSSP